MSVDPSDSLRPARPRSILTFTTLGIAIAVVVGALACGGRSAAPAPSQPTVPLRVNLAVTNTTFGTATASDFPITVSGTPIDGVSVDATGTVLLSIREGAEFKVSISGGPAGYAATMSGSCAGTAAGGLTPCTVKLDEQAMNCDDRLWAPVYRRDRLKLLDNCRSGSGVVADVGLEPDGDLVMEVVPDQASQGLMRPGNRTDPDAHGHLVVEVPCQTPSREQEPSAACASFTGEKIEAPVKGMHIAAAAHWVEDKNHSSWGELHGARIRVLPR